ncbi:histidine phosphotransferase ChpT [Cognatiyoonia koreensis]|uniref:Histidine phosphotransferase ChpT n=1 Tax=Cognatiyoonia koreensis TaxID=364200 RepID=A0A1I0PAV1_9RHOB|nr:histidine phosphotransferase family protein [Cognatiyoonia koreensis]SEW11278.1 histidine phosphotransferase ChpT [Cognatiyoonia koreensis]
MQDRLATLVGSRICHDLISPIGAIGNGVELLELTGASSGSELSLISESVQNANARIRFFRIAFGAAYGDQIISRKDVLSILTANARGGRLTYYWQAEGEHRRDEVRIAFLLLLCFETAMPTGGEVTVQRDGEDWVMTAVSDRLKIDEEPWNGLTHMGSSIDYSASHVQFAMLPTVMAGSHRKLRTDISATQIVARF